MEDKERFMEEESVKPAQDTTRAEGAKLSFLDQIETKLRNGESIDKEEGERLQSLVYKHLSLNPATTAQEAQEEPVTAEETPKEITEAERAIQLLAEYKQARSLENEIKRKEIQENTSRKKTLLREFEELLSTAVDFRKLRDDYKRIQQEWESIGEPDPTVKTAFMNAYKDLQERFYGLEYITKEYRDLNYAKNKQLKEELISTAEKLSESEDIISAQQALRLLHDRWKESGPAEPAIREELWKRFKAASATIHRRHSEHFEKIKAQEQENLQRKEEICGQIEAIIATEITKPSEWKKKGEQVLKLKEDFNAVGQVPRKQHREILPRFRKALSTFYSKRRKAFQQLQKERQELELKFKALVEEAKAVSESSERGQAAQRLIALQKEWKDLATDSVYLPGSDKLWTAFRGYCDAFFTQQKERQKSRNSRSRENSRAKDIQSSLAPQKQIKKLKEQYKQYEQNLGLFTSTVRPEENPLLAPILDKMKRIEQEIMRLEEQQTSMDNAASPSS